MGRRKKGDKINGWVNLDKPLGMTSTQAVGKVRRLYNAQKAGHAGTLDPLASGILPIALGEATKTIPYIQDSLKTYSFTVTWGEQRDTDDREGEVIAISDVRPSEEDIKAALPRYTGHIQQIPPKFSAIKVDGQRAYDLARDGQDVELKSREVYIETLELTRHPSSFLCHSAEGRDLVDYKNKLSCSARRTVKENKTTSSNFIMTCSKGTYVRSLARDLALELGSVGYISALRRDNVGPFTLENAISLDKLEELSNSAALDEALLPLESALDDILALSIRTNEAADLRNGKALSFISKGDFLRLKDLDEDSDILATCNGKPVALVEREGPNIKPFRVFNL